MKNKLTTQSSGLRKKALIISALCTLSSALVILAACSKSKSPAAMQAAKITYHCPMHPQIVSDKPGDCPICNMRLVPTETSSTPEPPVTDGVPGQAPVQVPSAQQQTIGVTLTSVERKPLYATVRAAARVAYDPALYSAILEHRQTLQALPIQEGKSASSFQDEMNRTVRASRLRLRQMGLSDEQIDQMSRPGFDPSNLLLSHKGGTVWVYAEVYDYEAPGVKPGQVVDLTSPALAGRVLTGKVRSIDNVLNSESRTFRARIEVSQAANLLRPEMYLTAAIRTEHGAVVAVPKSAVMPTGSRSLVFMETSTGRYEPREVRLGREGDDSYEVLEGLKEGDKVVTSANFLIDSESKIKAAIQKAGDAAPSHQH